MKQVKDIIVVGAGGHAKACIDVIEQLSDYRVCGLVGSPEEVGDKILGYSVLGSDADLPILRESYQYACIAIGQVSSAPLRRHLSEALKSNRFEMPVLISPHAYVSRHSIIAQGTVVMHGAIVNAHANIGSQCIINTNALIEHDANIGDNCHISTRAVINGSATIGADSFIGSGAILRDGITVGENCIVGMGVSLKRGIDSGCVVKQ